MQIILNSLLRVVTIKLKKKSHFLLESQTIEEIIGKFKGYVGNLRPVQKLMLGKDRHIKPWNIEALPSWAWLEWPNAIVDFLMLILKDKFSKIHSGHFLRSRRFMALYMNKLRYFQNYFYFYFMCFMWMVFTIEYWENYFILFRNSFILIFLERALILIPGRVLLRNVVPGPIFNEVFFSLKDDFLSNKVDSAVSRV